MDNPILQIAWVPQETFINSRPDLNVPVSLHLPTMSSFSLLLRPLVPTRLLPLTVAMVWVGLLAWPVASVRAQVDGGDDVSTNTLPLPFPPVSSVWVGVPLLPPSLKPSVRLQETINPAVRNQLPSYIRAEHVQGQTDVRAVLEGNAELRRGDAVIRAEHMQYTLADDTVNAQGDVYINHAGNMYQGIALKMQVDAFRGDFHDATYRFLQTQGHGDAARVEFINREQSVVHQATYTTCQRDNEASWEPDWMIRAQTIELDRASDVGVARNGVLEFKGVPILPVPTISFPLSDQRKSGLLPPTVGIDSVSGVEYTQPYYWNIAPNRDATITPTLMSKRGLGLGTEFRYLEPQYQGDLSLNFMPSDELRDRDRWSYLWQHQTSVASPIGGLGLDVKLSRVSDNDYWRDFNRRAQGGSLTDDRLIESRGTLSWGHGGHTMVLRAQKWQTLQDIDVLIAPPFDRLPQLQWRYEPLALTNKMGLDWRMETDTTRFRARTTEGQQHRDNGQRSYLLAQVSRPMLAAGSFLTPKLQLHSSSYRLDNDVPGRSRSQSFSIPTFSLDSGVVLERQTSLLGTSYLQTLEPRAFYTYTPYHDQSTVPLYDTALSDFNLASIYSENSYTGHDRIADNNMVTVGITTRYLQPDTGAEFARFGVAQRRRFSNQRTTLGYDAPGEKGWSDILVGAGVNWNERWSMDGLVQYNQDINRTVRSSVSGRYSPGPYRTLSAAYRYLRPSSIPIVNSIPVPSQGSEQIDLGWQWPLNGYRSFTLPDDTRGGRTTGRWYSVGRLNYSMQDKKLVDAIVGFEYDSCCWISRVVLERLQNSRTQSNTRLLFQIEFVGLSRLSLGSSPLDSLQEHVPGYRPLRDEQAPSPSRFSNYD